MFAFGTFDSNANVIFVWHQQWRPRYRSKLSRKRGQGASSCTNSRTLPALLPAGMGDWDGRRNQFEKRRSHLHCAFRGPERENTGAQAVIHTHSKAAVIATLLYPGKEFRITHQEMIKGIRKGTTGTNYRYDDTLVVPIIENTPEEKDLKDRMARAMEEYPDSCAVLVRRHGVYVWGESWEKAKTMCECYDYLFDVAVQMKHCGLDPSAFPVEKKGIV
ncbi:methylthioribulose-1-phosphate dehydratase isoform X6 [Phyllopteryx taeniolatus]|uniref:methylthioribulose-1-phosphate dehydratase isoform X6 n=1 Tax=Phyllopteryx taeniolatus TaxID=161469 RepID=UPI002AD2F5F4|nr:methylthioribulose-1-phosphate dehydratase isoform X6 [Phyllopteryx taeniolatus]